VLNKMKWVAAILSMMVLAACNQIPSWGPGSQASQAPATTTQAGTPVTVTCNNGEQAIVKQVSISGGQTVAHVECVAPLAMPVREVALLEDEIRVAPQPPRRVAPKPVVKKRAPAPKPAVVDAEPEPEPVREASDARDERRDGDYDESGHVYVPRDERRSDRDREPQAETETKKRKGEESAAIIVGTTAAGAGVGAIIGGKKGAIIGAILGGAGGTIYDRKTRNKKPKPAETDRDADYRY
jgi:hypothetical protein